MLLLTFYYLTNNGAGAELLREVALFIGFAVCGWRPGLFSTLYALCSMLKDLISLCI
jgi:hypothetical protein